MEGDEGSSAGNPEACDDQLLRSHIESAAAGKTDHTDEQLVDLLLDAFPQFYSGCDRNLLTERVGKITLLLRRRDDAVYEPAPVSNKRQKTDDSRGESVQRRDDAIDEPAPVSNKRQKTDDARGESVQRRDDAVHESAPVSNNRQKTDDSRGESVQRRDARGASVQNVPFFSSDTSSSSVPTSEELNQSESDEVDGERRELIEDGNTMFKDLYARKLEWRDGSRSNCPMFKDLYGSRQHKTMIEELKWDVMLPLHQLKLMRHFGVDAITRILLHGPPGCGKTVLARAIANEAGVPFCEISAAALVSGVSDEAEENIQEIFSTAHMKAPSIVFIDEIDAMTSKIGSLQKVTEPCILKRLIACMDEAYRLVKPGNHDASSERSNSRPGHVLVIGATNCPDALDPTLRLWFDHEFVIAAPDEKGRCEILSGLTHNLKVEVGCDLAEVATWTVGFVARDLVALVREAGKVAANRTLDRRVLQNCKEPNVEVQFEDCCRQLFSDEEFENLCITMSDFLEAGYMVKPSFMESFSKSPEAKWDDIVGLHLLKSEFERHIIKRIKFPEVYKNTELNLRTRFFLYGPPGTGKTMIVEALANEAGAKLIHIKASHLCEYGKQRGLVVRNLFGYARTCSPCILFFDELKEKSYGAEGWPGFKQLLSELRDVQGDLSGVYVIGASNELKVGEHFRLIQRQFHKILYAPLPTPKQKGAILKIYARDKPIDADVDLMAVGKDLWNYNASDISIMMQEAAKIALYRAGGCSGPWTITNEDFEIASNITCNEVTHHENKKYKRYAAQLSYMGALYKDDCW